MVIAYSGVVPYYITKSSKYFADANKENHMNTSVSTKFAALAIALFANTVLLGCVAVLFNAHQTMPVAIEQPLVHTAAVA